MPVGWTSRNGRSQSPTVAGSAPWDSFSGGSAAGLDGVEADPVDLLVVPGAEDAAEYGARQAGDQDGGQCDEAGGGRGALVDRDPRQVQLREHVVLRAEHQPGPRQQRDADQAYPPPRHAVLAPVDPGPPAGEVATAPEEQKEQNQEGDPAT